MWEEEKCCGTCRYHKKDYVNDDWMCINPESEYGGCYTGYDDCCEDQEER